MAEVKNPAGEQSDLRLAVLIDADNVSHGYVHLMMAEVARYGKPTIKRIYGDWTRPEAGGWKRDLLANAITPMQQYSYTTGKNSTDSAMIIDAMDILYTGSVEGFCIVSSDSDFTRLATRLREAGVLVIGIGEKKTPEPFIASCDRFIYLEILGEEQEQEEKKSGTAGKKNGAGRAVHKQHNKIPPQILKLLVNSVNDVADDDGWAFLGDVGNLILRKQPSFDSRSYGYHKLTALINTLERFEVQQRDTSNRGIKHIYIRDKNGGQ